MSALGRLLTFFPTLQIVLCIAFIALSTRSPLWLLALPFVIYALPLITFRIINLFLPLREGRSFLDGPRYSPWWGSHNLQRLFIAVPQLESLLQLIPGAFSIWLRLWGSDVGKRVHWTPRVEIADRGLLEIGDNVVVGHKVECYAHAIKQSHGRLVLYVKRIRIGRGAFLGAGVRMGPGARVEDGATVPTLTDLYINQVLANEVIAQPEANAAEMAS
jgi:hypothetical protein